MNYLKDSTLDEAINHCFFIYDTDHSGFLEENEIKGVVHDICSHFGWKSWLSVRGGPDVIARPTAASMLMRWCRIWRLLRGSKRLHLAIGSSACTPRADAHKHQTAQAWCSTGCCCQ